MCYPTSLLRALLNTSQSSWLASQRALRWKDAGKEIFMPPLITGQRGETLPSDPWRYFRAIPRYILAMAAMALLWWYVIIVVLRPSGSQHLRYFSCAAGPARRCTDFIPPSCESSLPCKPRLGYCLWVTPVLGSVPRLYMLQWHQVRSHFSHDKFQGCCSLGNFHV